MSENINKIAHQLVRKVCESNPQFTELEYIKMEYGLTCLFEEMSKLFLYAVFFSIFSLQQYFLVTLIFFCPIRVVSGGYHAKTYVGCLITSFGVVSLIILLGKYGYANSIFIASSLIASLILICIFSPVDNENKRIKSEDRIKRVKYISIAVTLLLIVLVYLMPKTFLVTAALSIDSAVVLMIIGTREK